MNNFALGRSYYQKSTSSQVGKKSEETKTLGEVNLRLEKLGKKISHRYRLFIITIMRPRLSNTCIHEFFTIDKTMELSVFYCTMHSSIENLFTSSHNKILS
ncbi:hypothetical protein E2986_13473 [Frieseomelitta varia]|uniref:Uncharacterized protein n=1 Tax=Frieseomelitta varia TaxID=561572 RepID=A0A833VQV4_9HYME|nr:hypothetical protein E2986_13473 [Frieseomelitta varia]